MYYYACTVHPINSIHSSRLPQKITKYTPATTIVYRTFEIDILSAPAPPVTHPRAKSPTVVRRSQSRGTNAVVCPFLQSGSSLVSCVTHLCRNTVTVGSDVCVVKNQVVHRLTVRPSYGYNVQHDCLQHAVCRCSLQHTDVYVYKAGGRTGATVGGPGIAPSSVG